MYNIEIKDLPEELISFAQFVGKDMFIKICEEYGGNQIYFPKKDSLIRKSRDKEIKSNYNGHNYIELGRKYGLTSNQIRKIVK